eukprot:2091706-Prymnesium_polylepis.1
MGEHGASPAGTRLASYDGSPMRKRALTVATAQGLDAECTVRMSTMAGRTVWLHCSLDQAEREEDHLLHLLQDSLGGRLGSLHIYVTMANVTISHNNKALVRSRYELSYNSQSDDAVVARLLSPSLVFNPAGTQLPHSKEAEKLSGAARYLDRRRLLLRAFPDLRLIILEQNCKDDSQVFTSWQWSATHSGPYLSKSFDGTYADLPPTGQAVIVHGIAIDVCKRGQIVDHAAFYD